MYVLTPELTASRHSVSPEAISNVLLPERLKRIVAVVSFVTHNSPVFVVSHGSSLLQALMPITNPKQIKIKFFILIHFVVK